MSTGYCTEVPNHYFLHLQLILHCTLANWSLNESLKKGTKGGGIK